MSVWSRSFRPNGLWFDSLQPPMVYSDRAVHDKLCNNLVKQNRWGGKYLELHISLHQDLYDTEKYTDNFYVTQITCIQDMAVMLEDNSPSMTHNGQ